MAEESKHIMDELLIKYLAGEHSESEGQEVEVWLKESEENHAHMEELRKVWGMMDQVDEKELAVIDDAWRRFQDRVGEKPAKILRPLWRQRWVQLAAVLLVGLAFVGGILALLNLNAGPDLQQLVNQSSEPLKQTLADGSTVFLKPGAVLTYPEAFDGESRTVQLEGEAFFEIERDTAHPFLIQTQATEIEVLGTSFLVRALKEEVETEVVVKTGRVAVRPKQEVEKSTVSEKILTKGMAAKHVHAKQEVELVEPPTKQFDAWVPKAFLFANIPMEEVVQQLSDAYGVQVDFLSLDDEACTYFGQYNGLSLEQIIDIISRTGGYEVDKTATGYLIKGSNCQQ